MNGTAVLVEHAALGEALFEKAEFANSPVQVSQLFLQVLFACFPLFFSAVLWSDCLTSLLE